MKETIPIVSSSQKQVQVAIDQLVDTGAERGNLVTTALSPR